MTYDFNSYDEKLSITIYIGINKFMLKTNGWEWKMLRTYDLLQYKAMEKCAINITIINNTYSIIM